jgi:hypothetical protein
MTPEDALRALARLVGTWTIEATHPAMPGIVVAGRVTIEWLEGERFLIHRSRNDHPDFPDSISIIGYTERDRVDKTRRSEAISAHHTPMAMHYFDSRGVFRLFDVSLDTDVWRIWRDAPGFSQRYVGRFADGGRTIAGGWQLCEDDVHWHDDLKITYRRQE